MITKPIIGDDEEAEAKRIEKNNNNIIIQSLREKYKVEGNQIDFSKMNLEDRILYSRLGQAEDYDDEVSAWIENYKRVEKYYADRWPSDLSPDSEVMFIRRTDSKIPTTVYDRFDTDMHQRQIRNLNNNSTGAIEDQVNPKVKKGELD
jgi:hypothetical protein